MRATVKKTKKSAIVEPMTTLQKVSKREIAPTVQCLLWGRAAGRCEFEGCNKPLWKSAVTQESVNVAEKAHIYAFSSGGPRGNRGVPKRLLNKIENLLLVCHDCHRKIDRHKTGGRYPVRRLRTMKSDHEQRIERVTQIAPNKRSHVVLYGANIGDHCSPLRYSEAAEAMFPARYPAIDRAIELGTHASSFTDRDAAFWDLEAASLRRKFSMSIRERLAAGEVGHLSTFGLAPQPLLILFGTLIGDIAACDVYQRHREPRPTWQWPTRATTQEFIETAPEDVSGIPALVLALSATVTRDRIVSAVGDNVSVWSVSVPRPHNDVMKSRQQLSELRKRLRDLLNRIKAAHGQNTVLHVFPVAPNSANIELGRVRMPKADMPWQLYDQLQERGGFVRALLLGAGDDHGSS